MADMNLSEKRGFMNKKIVWLLLVGSIFSVPGFCSELEDAITKGSEYVQKKEYDKAVVEYERAVKIDPRSSKAYLLLGLTYANVGKLDLAVKYTSNSIVLEPTYAGYHNLGLIYANQGDYDRAKETYGKALEINPSSFRAWYEMGLLEAGNGFFREAVAAYQKAVELNHAFPEAHLGLGSANYWNGDKDGAMAEVGALRELKHKDEADALESWINDKEAKKTTQAQAAAAASQAPAVKAAAPEAPAPQKT